MRRVELHPATDRWMMGDRTGTVIDYRTKKGQRQVKIHLDVSGHKLWFHEDDINKEL